MRLKRGRTAPACRASCPSHQGSAQHLLAVAASTCDCIWQHHPCHPPGARLCLPVWVTPAGKTPLFPWKPPSLPSSHLPKGFSVGLRFCSCLCHLLVPLPSRLPCREPGAEPGLLAAGRLLAHSGFLLGQGSKSEIFSFSQASSEFSLQNVLLFPRLSNQTPESRNFPGGRNFVCLPILQAGGFRASAELCGVICGNV